MAEDQSPKRRQARPTHGLGVALSIAALLLITATVAGHLPGWWWRFALLEHGRLQLLLGLAVVAAGLGVLRWRWWTLASIGGAAVNLMVLLPYWLGGSSGEPTLTLMHLNTDRGQPAVLAHIEDRTEDLILLQEVTPDFAEELQAIGNYRLVLANPLDNTHGSALLVHHDWDGEVIDSQILHIPSASERPLISATLLVDGEPVTVISYHAIRPGRADTTRYHGSELNHLAAWIEAHEGEAIVIGDFNATPWSAPVRELEAAGLIVSNRGHGLAGTWPSTKPGFLRIPIDLGLHTDGWETVEHVVGPSLGGDHLPLHLGLVRQGSP